MGEHNTKIVTFFQTDWSNNANEAVREAELTVTIAICWKYMKVTELVLGIRTRIVVFWHQIYQDTELE